MAYISTCFGCYLHPRIALPYPACRTISRTRSGLRFAIFYMKPIFVCFDCRCTYVLSYIATLGPWMATTFLRCLPGCSTGSIPSAFCKCHSVLPVQEGAEHDHLLALRQFRLGQVVSLLPVSLVLCGSTKNKGRRFPEELSSTRMSLPRRLHDRWTAIFKSFTA